MHRSGQFILKSFLILGLAPVLSLAAPKPTQVRGAVSAVEAALGGLSSDRVAQQTAIEVLSSNKELNAATRAAMNRAGLADFKPSATNLDILGKTLATSTVASDVNLSKAIVGLVNTIKANGGAKDLAQKPMLSFMAVSDVLPTAQSVALTSDQSDRVARIQVSLLKKLNKINASEALIAEVNKGFASPVINQLLGKDAEKCIAGNGKDPGFQSEIGVETIAQGIAAASGQTDLAVASEKADGRIMQTMRRLQSKWKLEKVRAAVCQALYGQIDGCEAFALGARCPVPAL